MDRGTTTVAVPWQTTIINSAYRSVVNSWNIDLTVAARSVVAGSVTADWANVTANGTQSVTIGFVHPGSARYAGMTRVMVCWLWLCIEESGDCTAVLNDEVRSLVSNSGQSFVQLPRPQCAKRL